MPTILFHKPFGVLSSFTGEPGQVTLRAFLDIPNIYAAGRLDKNSEGLLLLTSDGRLIQQITDPRFEHSKLYLAQVEGMATESAFERLRTGIVLDGRRTLPVEVRLVTAAEIPPEFPDRLVRAYHPTTWIQLALREGKKHQVRRMTAACGFPTLRLLRIAIGALTIAGLNPGEWRDLTQSERASLLNYHH